MNRSRRALLCLASVMLAFALLVGGTNEAQAFDRYSALFCVTNTGSNAALGFNSTNFAYNTSATNNASVTCPFRHSFSTVASRCADISIVDQNASSNSFCDIHVRRPTSTSFASFVSTTGSSATAQQLYLASPTLGPADVVSLRCTLVPGTTSAIMNYALDTTCPPI